MEPCDHDGFHSGQGRYDFTAERLRFVEICDACEAEVRELGVAEYRPLFEPTARAGRLSPASAQA